MAEITYAVYQHAKVGYTESGDRCLVRENGDNVLVCVVDGLGSGPAAAQAAQTAVDWVAAHDQAPLSQIVRGCHDALRHTRGAAVALVRMNMARRELTFVGVGNVEFYAWSAEPMRPISYAGIVGSRLPILREFQYHLSPGDVIFLHTDGISRRFALEDVIDRGGSVSPQQLAEAIARSYAKRNDDATLLVLSFAPNSNMH